MMTDRRECEYTRDLCKITRAQQVMDYPLIGSAWAPPGWPDRLFVHRELPCPVFVEFKMNGEQPEPHQASIHWRLRKRGALVFVAFFADDTYVGLDKCEWVLYTGFMKQLIGVARDADTANRQV